MRLGNPGLAAEAGVVSASFKGHMAEKRVVNHSGDFHLVRHQQAQNFSCERCMQPKTSKTIVTWIGHDSVEKTICNGCYGFLCAVPKNKD
jgi:hypothetical protein